MSISEAEIEAAAEVLYRKRAFGIEQCREIQHAALEAAERVRWQPIENAPKDTAILVYNYGYTVAHFNTAYDRWIAYGRDTPDTIALAQFLPTHFQPLPSPPESKSK
jgi:hypothetical protein